MKTFVLSAGHNPDKKGAKWADLYEYDVTSKWIPEIARYLRYKGHSVIEIKTGSLVQKVKDVNVKTMGYDDVLAVELHFNSAGDTFVEGSETIYYPGSVSGHKAALEYNTKFFELAEKYVIKDRGIKEGWHRMDRPGVVDFYGDQDGDEMPNYWLRKTSCTALILEPLFMCQLPKLNDNWKELCWSIGDSLRAVK
jgi:hypothetical protein